MIARIQHNNKKYNVDLHSPIDISIPISSQGVSAWGLPPVTISPVRQGSFVGDVAKGGGVNFNNIHLNPHAHSTHTECVGHISRQKESLNIEVKNFFFMSQLITLKPNQKNKDFVINKRIIQLAFKNKNNVEALIIRTSPNNQDKINRNYSNTNPPYFLKEAIDYIVDLKIKHLLIDLPSVDKERDGGKLVAHKSFWKFPKDTRHGCTITELIYAPDTIEDGPYLLNLQFAPFENDASPSRPVLFKLSNLS